MKYQWFLDNQTAIVEVWDGVMLLLLYIKMLFILVCMRMVCLREWKLNYTHSVSGLLKLCFKWPQAKFWLWEMSLWWPGLIFWSCSPFLAPCVPSLSLPTPTSRYYWKGLGRIWQKPFTGKSFIGLFAFWKRIWKEAVFNTKEWTFEVVKRTGVGIGLVSLKSHPVADSSDK